jgi:spore coat protein H
MSKETLDRSKNLMVLIAVLALSAGCPVATVGPTAEAGGPYSGEVDETIVLDGSASTSTDSLIVLCEWDLDNDGQYDDATGVTADFSSGTAGTFTVGLRVTDDDRGTGTDTATVRVTAPLDDTDFQTTDWTDETHSKSADPNFAEVFDDAQVKRFDIVITSERWQSMLDDMTELYGTFGGGFGPPPGGELIETEDPIFVPAEVFYNGIQWYRVGVRFKGNSSLQTSWESGILKLSFKLDFDEFEDDYPQIDNQRFYGFKKLSLKNNYEDRSLLREKVTADVLADAGLPVSHTALYELHVDHGDGPEYFGLYTLVEEVDNTVIKTQFSDDDGNLYKPEDTGASFVSGTFNETDFEKKTNEDDEDWTDILALFTALHDGTRTTAPATWRANLESVLDTDVFLKWLAVNTVVQNWDSYGKMTQNYYLYNDPDTGRLTWIPWDHNEALQEGKLGGALDLDFANIESGGWPLIEYLYADDVYRAQYDQFVREIAEGPFETNYIQQVYAYYSTLIEPSVIAERAGYTFLNSSSDFYQAVSELHAHAYARAAAVDTYLNP